MSHVVVGVSRWSGGGCSVWTTLPPSSQLQFLYYYIRCECWLLLIWLNVSVSAVTVSEPSTEDECLGCISMSRMNFFEWNCLLISLGSWVRSQSIWLNRILMLGIWVESQNIWLITDGACLVSSPSCRPHLLFLYFMSIFIHSCPIYVWFDVLLSLVSLF